MGQSLILYIFSIFKCHSISKYDFSWGRIKTSLVGRFRAGPVSKGSGGKISLILGSQVSQRLRYCKTAEVYFTTLLWKNNRQQNGLRRYRECCIPNCTKLWWI